MHRILFICRGNICRSTMAQFVMEDLVRRAGRGAEFTIDSAATSTEELGNPPHPGTVRVLNRAGVPVGEHRARQVRRAEYDDWDLIVYMDAENARGLRRILDDDPNGKCVRLLELTVAPIELGGPQEQLALHDLLDGLVGIAVEDDRDIAVRVVRVGVGEVVLDGILRVGAGDHGRHASHLGGMVELGHTARASRQHACGDEDGCGEGLVCDARPEGPFRSVCARSRAAAGGRQPRRTRCAFNLSGADDG